MRNASKSSFKIGKDPIGLGWRVVVSWSDGSTEYVTGMGGEDQARKWIENDAPRWVAEADRLTTPKDS